MRALINEAGQVKLAEVPKPIPGPGEVLIKIILAGICNTDLEVLAGYRDFDGVLGHEFVGFVHADPRDELTGKRVVGSITIFCGQCWFCRRGETSQCLNRTTIGINHRDGAFAEYIVLPRENVHIVPDTLSDMEAVLIEPLAAGMRILEQAHIRPLDKVVVLGDGKLGMLTAIALWVAGNDVTIIGKHVDKLSTAAGMGLKTEILGSSDLAPDVVVDCTGSSSGLEAAIDLIRSGGTIFLKTTVASTYTIDLSPVVVREIKIIGSRCGPFAPALALMERLKLELTDLVEAVYPLERGAEAFDHASRKGSGKILLSTSDSTGG